MKKLLFFGALTLMSHSLFAQPGNKLLSAYIDIKNKLVESDSKAAAKAALELQQTIKAEPAFEQKDNLQRTADKLAKAGSIDKQRDAFNEVSTMLWQVLKKSGKLQQPVYYQYCPMKKSFWLSMDKEIRNPYYGAAMLACGKVIETN